jgi:hypothetical protein
MNRAVFQDAREFFEVDRQRSQHRGGSRPQQRLELFD